MTTKTYKWDRIGRLAKNMAKADIDQATIGKVLKGGEAIDSRAKPEVKAAWYRDTMARMEDCLDLPARRTVMEACACCLTGKRDQMAKAIARENATLEARIKAAGEAHYVFGHSVTGESDGSITVAFFPEGQAPYRCPCMSRAQMQMPITYCFCCGGHVKHHLQNALGRKLDCTVVKTVRSSGGREPCTFSLKIVE